MYLAYLHFNKPAKSSHKFLSNWKTNLFNCCAWHGKKLNANLLHKLPSSPSRMCSVSFVCWHERKSQTRKLVKNFGKNSARLLALPCSVAKKHEVLSFRIRLQRSHNL